MTSPANTSFMVPSNILDNEMNVTKRNGQLETVSFDKILQRMKRIGTEAGIKVNYTSLAMKVIDQLYDGISTTKIDELSAEQCASMASIHYDYNALAGRIIVSNHHKNTSDSFSAVMRQLHGYLDKHGKPAPLVSDELIAVVEEYSDFLDRLCRDERDYLIDYFGFKTLDRAYLMKINGKTVERPQHMWMRVAIGIHGPSINHIIETYDLMSQKYFTHATPTLFNAGTPRPQLSSCFLIAMENDSIDGIYNTLKDCALISKMAGGIGLHIHNVRATGSHIRGTNGTSNGIVPMLKVFNNTAKYVDQCVHPETIIYTTHGPKQIQHCTTGETQIFNMNGETEVIQNVLEHQYEGEILEIHSEFVYNNKLIITPQHPIYVLRNNEKQWIDAGDILLTDKIIYSIPTYENDIENITEDDCRMYGYIIKYGCIENLYYKIHIKNGRHIDFIKEYLDSRLVEYELIDNYLKGMCIIWKPALQLPFRYSDVYNESNVKRIHSRWLHLSLNKIKVLSSIFEDCEYDKGIDSQVSYLLLRLSMFEVPCGLESIEEGFVCSNIVSISKTHYNGILYDLQMEQQHDYLLEHGLVHNGGGKRNGSFAIYLEPWHADIEMFLQMRKNHGDEELKARDLFYAIWMPDLFMERVKANGKWTLMCPDECPGLSDVYGDEFKMLYEGYETANKGRESVNARDLWFKMLDAQMETGMPYIVYKDACNKKSNQKNIGIIKSSNLCVAPETQILTDKGHIEIQSLENKTVNVWNGEDFSEVTVRKTGTNQSLIKVEMTDGSFLECTPYHKFWIIRDAYETIIPASELVVGDITITYIDSNTGSIIPSKIISNIIDNGRRDDTFCFTEPKRNMGIFNGIITGQCSEVVQYSDATETAVCNLASIGLPSFVLNDFTFDYEKLHEVAKVVTKNLNKIIDVNYYPTEKTRKSNMRHRPIGIGVQGLADVFMLMNISFLSDAAKKINRDIFETIYHAALESSCEIAEEEGAYETFFATDTAEGSPASQGILQFDLWGVDPGSDRYDWSVLKEKIKHTGLRNSLLLAPMPTASTSQILGFNECIEPITSNIYSRRTLAGEFIQANKYLMADLINAGLWNEKIKNNMIANNGSIQHIDVIPQEIKDKYKTVWELPMRGLIDMAADRGAFICQSQSLNLWLEDPNYSTLTAMHFYSWQKGLKTGIYYLRRRGKHQAQQFTIEPEKAGHMNTEEDEICEMCSA